MHFFMPVKNYKGSGTPDYYCTPHQLNVMLLARDMNGRRIYSSKAELASALNVGDIYTAEQFEGKIRTTSDNKKKKLLGIMVNLADYSLGCHQGRRGDAFHTVRHRFQSGEVPVGDQMLRCTDQSILCDCSGRGCY